MDHLEFVSQILASFIGFGFWLLIIVAFGKVTINRLDKD